eukprot:5350350-Heterocapsa_arctica.AAC.1
MGLGIQVAELRDDLSLLTKITGIIVKDPELVEAKQRAEHAAEWVGPNNTFKAQLFTDGSAIYPESLWLRRASWSISWRQAGGEWAFVNGRTPGRQTVARSELYAVVWATEHGVPGSSVTASM